MAFRNLARETTATTGTASVVLVAAVAGCNTFDLAGVATGETVHYGIITYSPTTGAPTHSEVGVGVYTTATKTMTRATVTSSTNAGAKIDLTGVSEVFIAPAAGDLASKTDVMWHDQSIITVGNALTTAIDIGQRHSYVMYQNAAANGDTWKNGFLVQAGTYSLNFLSTKDADRGSLDVYIDDVLAGTIDFYAGSLTKNQTSTISSLTITDGYHTLKGVVNGKNASSSGYIIALTKIYLLPSVY